jgi:hypothetical protein
MAQEQKPKIEIKTGVIETAANPESAKISALAKVSNMVGPVLSIFKKKSETPNDKIPNKRPKGLIQTAGGVAGSVVFGGLSMMSQGEIATLTEQQTSILNQQSVAQEQVQQSQTTISEAQKNLESIANDPTIAAKIALIRNPELSSQLKEAEDKLSTYTLEQIAFNNKQENKDALSGGSEIEGMMKGMPDYKPSDGEVKAVDKMHQVIEYNDNMNLAKQKLQLDIDRINQAINSLGPIDPNTITIDEVYTAIKGQNISSLERESKITELGSLATAITNKTKAQEQDNIAKLGLTKANAISAPQIGESITQKTQERDGLRAGAFVGAGFALTGIFSNLSYFNRRKNKKEISEKSNDTIQESMEITPSQVLPVESIPLKKGKLIGPQLINVDIDMTNAQLAKALVEYEKLKGIKFPIKFQQLLINDYAQSKLVTRFAMIQKAITKTNDLGNIAKSKSKSIFAAFQNKLENYINSSLSTPESTTNIETVNETVNYETSNNNIENVESNQDQTKPLISTWTKRIIAKFNSLPIYRVQQLGASAAAIGILGMAQANTINLQSQMDGMTKEIDAEISKVQEFRNQAESNSLKLDQFTRDNQDIVNNLPILSNSQVLDILNKAGVDTTRLSKPESGDKFVDLTEKQKEYVRLTHQVIVDKLKMEAEQIGQQGLEAPIISESVQDIASRNSRELPVLQQKFEKSQKTTTDYSKSALATLLGGQLYAMFQRRLIPKSEDPES